MGLGFKINGISPGVKGKQGTSQIIPYVTDFMDLKNINVLTINYMTNINI